MSLKFIFTIILAFIVSACATSKKISTEDIPEKEPAEVIGNDVELTLGKNVSWVNLMPGSNPKFHISGRVSLLKSENYDFKSTELNMVKVVQSGKDIYLIKPRVHEELAENLKFITYSTISGLSINRDLDVNKTVDFELIFDEEEELKYIIKGIEVEEVQ